MKRVITAYAHLYLTWCKLYQAIERLTCKNYEVKRDRIINETCNLSIPEKFKYLLDSLKYKKDKWWQLGDVIADPVVTLSRGRGDCDDYAATAAWLFGREFVYNEMVFVFGGIYCLIWTLTSGHAIAVWKALGRDKYIVVSTEWSFRLYNSLDAILRDCYEYDGRKIKCGAVFDIVSDNIFRLKLKKAVKKKDLMR